MIIQDVLSHKGADVKTVSRGTRLALITEILTRFNIASLVVVDAARQPVGLITERIVTWAIARRGKDALDLVAEEVMERQLPECAPGDSLRHAMRAMTEHRIRHLLVREKGVMVGIVSIGDLVKSHIRNTELENRVLRDIARARMAAA